MLVGCTQKVRLRGQLSKEVKVISDVPQGSVLGPLQFLVYVNDIWKNIDPSIRLFADGCIICSKITNKNDIEKFEEVFGNPGEMSGTKWDENKPW